MTLITRNTASPSPRDAGAARPFLIAALLGAALLLFFAVGSRRTLAQAKQAAGPLTVNPDNPAQVARGRYIVEGVAYCTNCHTPRNPDGSFDRTRWLKGGPVFFQPAFPMPDWPQMEPRIAGQPPTTDAGMIHLLTTGLWTDGKPLRQPMPQFHMTPADAAAVVAYLKTL